MDEARTKNNTKYYEISTQKYKKESYLEVHCIQTLILRVIIKRDVVQWSLIINLTDSNPRFVNNR